MVYRKVQGEALPVYDADKTEYDSVSYRVYDGEKPAAEFSYHIECLARDEGSRFWIDEIRLSDAYGDRNTMEAVLHFIQYKCRVAGCPAMHVRLASNNIFYIEMYRKFGFYLIDEEERKLPPGRVACMSVLKYPLPESRDDVLRNYIMRSERKRAGRQPK